MTRRRARRLTTRLLEALDVDARDVPVATAATRRALRRRRWTPRTRARLR